MKLITRDTDYAVRALCYIAVSKEKMVTAAKLIEDLNMPRPFLRKVLQNLNRKGILLSYRGKGGGFALARPAKKVLLSELIENFQGPLQINECIFKKKICPNRSECVLRQKISSIENHVISELNQISISDLI